MLILCLFQKVILIDTKDRKVTIYGLNSKYESTIQIPSDKIKLYQIDAGSSGKYKVKRVSGSAVSVSKEGTITPNNITWYWYGNKGYSVPQQGKTANRIETRVYPGESVVTVQVGNISFNINVTSIEYGEEYAENIINSYLKTNVTNQKTQLEKFNAITAFPAQFPYNGRYQTYIDMIVFQGGDCWASADTIQHLCEKVGIKSHITSEVLLPGMWTGGHKNTVALIDGKIYVGEAGFGIAQPNRLFMVFQQNVGYFYNKSEKELTISQYDGYDEDVKVPSIIDNKTVIGFTKKCFFNGQSWSGIKIKSITLPYTIYSLGDETFNDLKYLLKVDIPYNVTKINTNVFAGCDNLESINIAKNNSQYISEEGILYDKNKKNLFKYPSAKENKNFAVPSSLERIEDYSFTYTKNIEVLNITDKVNYIGSYAFSSSNVKEIYFFGDKPNFGEKPFNNTNITFYCLNENSNWNVDFKTLGLKDFRTCNCTSKEDSHLFLIIGVPIISCIVIIIIIFLVYIMIRKSKTKNENINSLDGGLLNNVN